MIQLDHKVYNAPGILLSVRKDKEKISHFTSGLSDIQKNIPIEPGQLFRCGLITRIFTVAILLRLLDENAFNLDDPLEILARKHQQDRGLLQVLVMQYPILKPISVRELLNNTSGLPSFDKTIAYNEIFFKKPLKIWQVENYLDVISGVDVRYQYGYEPGVRGYFRDSSTNFMIASLVIEAICGLQTSEMMRELFREFSLDESQYLSHGVMEKKLLPRMMHGYLPISHPYAAAFENFPELTYNGNKELCAYDVTMAYTVNGMGNAASVSTSSNLIRWMDQLMNCQVVINNFKQLFTGVPIRRESREQQDYYCLGFYKSMTKSFGEIIWAAGNSLGYSSFLGHSVQKNITFALITNISRLHFGLHSEGLIPDMLKLIL
ncbi:MAG: hypothetical protein A3F10_02180 [Coxiella sp. RIFCSPHIGHO2_12_FULL_42_15]|nr:MAG: hypothetical protein A3F10_02180 [Coxiella sp. RIFCSPHIGHO2_12_FULL_42_15]